MVTLGIVAGITVAALFLLGNAVFTRWMSKRFPLEAGRLWPLVGDPADVWRFSLGLASVLMAVDLVAIILMVLRIQIFP